MTVSEEDIETMDIRTLHIPCQQQMTEYPVPNTTSTFTLWLEFEWWEARPDDDPEANFFNMQIHFLDGPSYALNVWTYRYLNIAHQEDCMSGDNLNGAYLLPPDLFVTKLDRSHIAAVVMDLAQHGRLREEWCIQENTTDAAIEADAEDPIFAQFVAQARAEGRITKRHADALARHEDDTISR